MKHTLQKITSLMVICLFAAFTGCQKDDFGNEQQAITTKTDTVNHLSEQEVTRIINMLHDQLDKARQNETTREICETLSIDEKDFAMINDQYGKQQYTFMAYREQSSETTFFNVIITDWDGYKKHSWFNMIWIQHLQMVFIPAVVISISLPVL